ncbi:MAG: hypothetical protein JRI68_06335 [Deltaproteobacteria bacterium]|nr:hypothetical protein [Deltaproteobacteria bacterium]
MANEDERDDGEPSRRPRKRKKKRARSHRGREGRGSHTVEKRWTNGQLMGTLVIALGVGALGGYQASKGGQAKDATPPAPVSGTPVVGSVAATGAPAGDQFGRAADDKHYGHNHPPQGAAAPPRPATSASGPDARGRAPGDEHYGHGHQ